MNQYYQMEYKRLAAVANIISVYCKRQQKLLADESYYANDVLERITKLDARADFAMALSSDELLSRPSRVVPTTQIGSPSSPNDGMGGEGEDLTPRPMDLYQSDPLAVASPLASPSVLLQLKLFRRTGFLKSWRPTVGKISMLMYTFRTE